MLLVPRVHPMETRSGEHCLRLDGRVASGARPCQGASRLLRCASALRVTWRVPAAQKLLRAVFDGPLSKSSPMPRLETRVSACGPRRPCSGHRRYTSASLFMLQCAAAPSRRSRIGTPKSPTDLPGEAQNEARRRRRPVLINCSRGCMLASAHRLLPFSSRTGRCPRAVACEAALPRVPIGSCCCCCAPADAHQRLLARLRSRECPSARSAPTCTLVDVHQPGRLGNHQQARSATPGRAIATRCRPKT